MPKAVQYQKQASISQAKSVTTLQQLYIKFIRGIHMVFTVRYLQLALLTVLNKLSNHCISEYILTTAGN